MRLMGVRCESSCGYRTTQFYLVPTYLIFLLRDDWEFFEAFQPPGNIDQTKPVERKRKEEARTNCLYFCSVPDRIADLCQAAASTIGRASGGASDHE
ncbi:Hypothetical protein NTJ_01150 [Nesidiocoris tenuis]|uniref:Uncharacterized protein n=1 Tax=Nesidiocoris tenuis TaxID=355587 RepID=A0ABN7A7U5_9HEMI|nr:Hypothetical protein NTJ_01150 [Nesidiocoris tenuis]